MPTNRNALIRYKTIDVCLQNRFRRWTLINLIDAVSDALYEYEGIDHGISKRTVQADIQMMRSDKLGYNAPIVVVDRKYYTYEDPNYSITNIPLSNQDLAQLSEAVEFLKQFQGFSHFRALGGMVQKLEDHIYAAKENQKSVIHFETNPNLKGLEHLDFIYKAIIKKQVLNINYQSFKARNANSFLFHAYLLKEFNNRWFVLGKKHNNQSEVLTLALDRIVGLAIDKACIYKVDTTFDAKEYYKNIIGVTPMGGMLPEKIVFKVDKKNAPYVATKPMHHSQQILKEESDWTTFAITVKINFELERLLVGFGESLEVISPSRLRRKMKYKFSKGLEHYQKNNKI